MNRQGIGSDGHRGDLQYGGRTFAAASRYLRALRSQERASVRLPRMVSDLHGLGALLAELRGLNRVPVSLSDTASGRSIARHLAERHRGVLHNRVAQGILMLPPTMPEYLRGRSRQALRTNVRAAAAQGLACTTVASAPALERTLRQWLAWRVPGADVNTIYEEWILKAPADAHWYIATDAAAAPLAIAAVCIDTGWGLLNGLVSLSHPARWLLHTHVVEQLYAAGGRNLCAHAGNALLLPPNVQYFQRLLGYQVAHLSVDERPG
jgi:hypothetical protein